MTDYIDIYSDSTYLLNNPTWDEEDSHWKSKQINLILKKNKIDPFKICEIGCGFGEILINLEKELGKNKLFFGYEISKQAFSICSKKKKDNINFFLKDILLENKTFYDLLLIMDVFEHVEDYFGFLKKLKGKGEYKVFHIPLDLSVSSVLRSTPIINARKLIGHIHYFTKETALATLKDTGYDVIDYFYTSGAVELKNRSMKTNCLNIPRKLLYLLNKDLAVRLLGGFALLVLAK